MRTSVVRYKIMSVLLIEKRTDICGLPAETPPTRARRASDVNFILMTSFEKFKYVRKRKVSTFCVMNFVL